MSKQSTHIMLAVVSIGIAMACSGGTDTSPTATDGPGLVSQPAATPTGSAASTGSLAGVTLGGVDAVTAAALVQAAEHDPWTRSEIAVGRTRLIQVLDAADGKGGIALTYVRYTPTLGAFNVYVDRETEQVTGHELIASMPDFSPGEVELASQIALADLTIRAIRTDWIVNNVTGTRCAEGRCIAVFLTPPDNDYGMLRIVSVDLVSEAVVGVQTGE